MSFHLSLSSQMNQSISRETNWYCGLSALIVATCVNGAEVVVLMALVGGD